VSSDGALWTEARRRTLLRLLERELPVSAELRVLAVGGADPGLIEGLQRYGEVWCVDPSPERVARCRELGITRVRRSPLEQLPVETGTVELMIVLDTLEESPDDEAALRECRRALDAGGLLLLSVPASPLGRRPSARARCYSATELRLRLVEADLRPWRLTHFGWLLGMGAGLDRLRRLAGEPSPTPRWLEGLAGLVASSEARLLERWDLLAGPLLLALVRPRRTAGSRS
jgi:SAM-dependent methyltransferase